MPLRWHVDLPGPVAWSKPVRKKRKAGLASVLAWFIVKPLELALRCSVAVVNSIQVSSHQDTGSEPYTATHGYFRPSELGWHQTQWGPLYWNGTNWYDHEGRAIF